MKMKINEDPTRILLSNDTVEYDTVSYHSATLQKTSRTASMLGGPHVTSTVLELHLSE